jgi:hypothetical protein
MNDQLQRELAELRSQVAGLQAELEQRPTWEDHTALERRLRVLEAAPPEDFMASNKLHINAEGRVE